MGGGGVAPSMKLCDVLLLTGFTLLCGGLFIHAWSVPIQIDESTYENGASLMEGDSIELELSYQTDGILRVVFFDEQGEIQQIDSMTLKKGTSSTASFTASSGGYYSYEVDTNGNPAELNVNIQRKYLIDFLPFVLGAFLFSYGLYTRPNDSIENEAIDAILD